MLFEKLRGIRPDVEDAEGPRPMQSLVAAARQISGRKIRHRSTQERWQDEAWCVDDATEILTVDGWRRHDEIAPGALVYTLDHATGTAGWEPVTDVARFQVTDEPMLALSMRHHSSLTTMAHRWPVLRQTYDNARRQPGHSNRAGQTRAWTTSRDLYAEDQIITAAPGRDLPVEAKWSDAFVELVAWFWTEGSIRANRARPGVTITQSQTANPGHVDRIRAALHATFGPPHDGSHPGRTAQPPSWREMPLAPSSGVVVFKLTSAAAEQLIAVAPGKVVTHNFIRSLTRAQLGLFLDVSVAADGHQGKYPAATLTQRERSRIEPYLFACVLAGITPHLFYSACDDMWSSTALLRTTAMPRRARNREVIPYTGTVWCPITHSQTWLARRDGTVWFTGNTLYRSVGELRFVANALANGMSRARLFAAKLPAGDDEPQPVNLDPAEGEEPPTEADRQASGAVAALGGGSLGRSELVRRLSLQLFVPGDGWIVGLPPGTVDLGAPSDTAPQVIAPGSGDKVNLEEMTWHAMSVSEVQISAGSVTLNIGDGSPTKVPEDRVMLIRVWRPDPERWWQADSPVRSNLPVIRELVGLTKHIGASIDSRLAGAGLLVLPQSVEVVPPTDPDNPDAPVPGVVDALMDAMLTPIQDRDSAAAVVPLIMKVPDEVAAEIGQGNLIQFFTEFDERSKELRDEAIRRLALGLDAPAEVLLGLSTANHWTGWAIEESTVKTHIDPVLALICDALTTQYLWPVLESLGVPDARDYVVWFDTVDLTLRPNRTAEATALYDKGELSGAALRREAGFGDEDAPLELEPHVRLALDMATQAPSLMANPGLGVLAEQIRALLAGEPVQVVAQVPAPGAAPPEEDGQDGDGEEEPDDGDTGQPVPDTRDDDPLAASSGNGKARTVPDEYRRRLAAARSTRG